MNKKLQAKVDDLSERIIDQASSVLLEEANDILGETQQYFAGLADLLEYTETDEDPKAVKEIAKEFLRSAIEMQKATNEEFDLTIAKLREMAK